MGWINLNFTPGLRCDSDMQLSVSERLPQPEVDVPNLNSIVASCLWSLLIWVGHRRFCTWKTWIGINEKEYLFKKVSLAQFCASRGIWWCLKWCRSRQHQTRENVKNESGNLSLFGKYVGVLEFCRHAKLYFMNGRINRINMLISLEIKITGLGTLCKVLNEQRTLLTANVILLGS